MRHVYNCGLVKLVWLGSRQRFLDPESLLCSERLSPRTAIIISACLICLLPVARCHLFSVLRAIFRRRRRRAAISGQIIFHLPYHVPRNTCACATARFMMIFHQHPPTREKCLNRSPTAEEIHSVFFSRSLPWDRLGIGRGKTELLLGVLKTPLSLQNSFHLWWVGGWILESPKNLSENIGGNSKDKQPRDELDDKQLCRLSTTAVGSHAIFVRFALIGELQTRQKSAKARLRDPASQLPLAAGPGRVHVTSAFYGHLCISFHEKGGNTR